MRVLVFTLSTFAVFGLSFACKPGTTAEFYDCMNSKQAGEKLDAEMKKPENTCIRKTGQRVAEETGCKVRFHEPK